MKARDEFFADKTREQIEKMKKTMFTLEDKNRELNYKIHQLSDLNVTRTAELEEFMRKTTEENKEIIKIEDVADLGFLSKPISEQELIQPKNA